MKTRLLSLLLARDGCNLSFGASNASRVTAVPRRSLNVTPTTPAFAHALRQEARKPSDVRGVPSMVIRMTVLRLSFAAASSASLSGAPTGIVTGSGRHPPTVEYRPAKAYRAPWHKQCANRCGLSRRPPARCAQAWPSSRAGGRTVAQHRGAQC
jgi:hypothetical protein